jgi:hypothetical protein
MIRTPALTDDQVSFMFETLLDLPPRAADLAALHVLCPSGITVEAVADYVWDHWMGEPEKPSLEQVVAAARVCVFKD